MSPGSAVGTKRRPPCAGQGSPTHQRRLRLIGSRGAGQKRAQTWEGQARTTQAEGAQRRAARAVLDVFVVLVDDVCQLAAADHFFKHPHAHLRSTGERPCSASAAPREGDTRVPRHRWNRCRTRGRRAAARRHPAGRGPDLLVEVVVPRGVVGDDLRDGAAPVAGADDSDALLGHGRGSLAPRGAHAVCGGGTFRPLARTQRTLFARGVRECGRGALGEGGGPGEHRRRLPGGRGGARKAARPVPGCTTGNRRDGGYLQGLWRAGL